MSWGLRAARSDRSPNGSKPTDRQRDAMADLLGTLQAEIGKQGARLAFHGRRHDQPQGNA